MYKSSPHSTLDTLKKEYKLSDAACVMIEKSINLKPDVQEVIFHYIQKVATLFQSKVIPLPTLTLSDNTQNTSKINDLEELSNEEFGKLIQQQLNLKKKVTKKSEIS